MKKSYKKNKKGGSVPGITIKSIRNSMPSVANLARHSAKIPSKMTNYLLGRCRLEQKNDILDAKKKLQKHVETASNKDILSAQKDLENAEKNVERNCRLYYTKEKNYPRFREENENRKPSVYTNIKRNVDLTWRKTPRGAEHPYCSNIQIRNYFEKVCKKLNHSKKIKWKNGKNGSNNPNPPRRSKRDNKANKISNINQQWFIREDERVLLDQLNKKKSELQDELKIEQNANKKTELQSELTNIDEKIKETDEMIRDLDSAIEAIKNGRANGNPFNPNKNVSAELSKKRNNRVKRLEELGDLIETSYNENSL